jgi:hypothetical protein
MLDHESSAWSSPSKRRPSPNGSKLSSSDAEEGSLQVGTSGALLPLPPFRFLFRWDMRRARSRSLGAPNTFQKEQAEGTRRVLLSHACCLVYVR